MCVADENESGPSGMNFTSRLRRQSYTTILWVELAVMNVDSDRWDAESDLTDIDSERSDVESFYEPSDDGR